MTSDDALPEFLASIQPIVLVGGKSRRFGRDKLREPWGPGGNILVQRPIEALRAVFGRRVKLVGECHPDILPLADGMIRDEYPGIGPMGGIVSALKAWGGPVFVLAGDMPNCDPATILKVVEAARRSPAAHAVLSRTDRLHPCAGIYRPAALARLQARLAAGRYALTSAVPHHDIEAVDCSPASLVNLNRAPA